MAFKNDTVFLCSECGFESAKWSGQCPSCHAWNTMSEFVQPKIKTPSAGKLKNVSSKPAYKLRDVHAGQKERISTGLKELDRVLGGGIVPDSVSIIAAKPGAGKSTLLMQLAQNLAFSEKKVLYVSGEESEGQLKRRAERILNEVSDNFWVLSTVSMDEVISTASSLEPQVLIIDSIQTFELSEFNSRPGTPTQIVECTSCLIQLAKNSAKPCAVFMAGQLTKEDELAGVRTLEHMVDTVLFMEADPTEELRLVSATKNRFGSTGEMGFFRMQEDGLKTIDNPSEYFMTKREDNENVSGCALCALKEGTRPMVAEVETLVSKSFTAYPTRISECLKRDSLATLISILEQRASLSFFDKNVVVKTTGGLKLSDNSSNLATLVSLTSSLLGISVSSRFVFIGDVSLAGELRTVPAMESMVKELDRMQFEKVFVPVGSLSDQVLSKLKSLEAVPVRTLKECLIKVFGPDYSKKCSKE